MNDTKTIPVFSGVCWSLEDAQKRRPGAWRITKRTFDKQEHDPVTKTWKVVGTHEAVVKVEDIAPEGIGHFERHTDGLRWVWVAPNGMAVPVTENYGQPEPPALPKKNPVKAACHCGPHRCRACGTMNWIEVHGQGDGRCTHCYARG